MVKLVKLVDGMGLKSASGGRYGGKFPDSQESEWEKETYQDHRRKMGENELASNKNGNRGERKV